MPESNQDFDQSFYVLCVVGYWILATDALDTAVGREKVKSAFRYAMQCAGSYAALEALPEFQAALRHVQSMECSDKLPFQAAHAAAVLTVDETDVSPLSNAGDPEIIRIINSYPDLERPELMAQVLKELKESFSPRGAENGEDEDEDEDEDENEDENENGRFLGSVLNARIINASKKEN
jgi:hypothetical protein